MTKKEILLDAFERIIQNKIVFNVSTEIRGLEHSLVRTYDDTCGQRGCYLTQYGFTSHGHEANRKTYPESFKVRRELSFTNPEDEGKQDAVLFTLHLSEVDKLKVSISDTRISIGSLVFNFRSSIF